MVSGCERMEKSHCSYLEMKIRFSAYAPKHETLFETGEKTP